MARVTYVKKARASKSRRSCCKCGTQINTGDSYKWFANRIGRMSMRKNFCSNCAIRPSDQTTSHHLSALYGATENAEDALASVENPTLDDIGSILRETAEAVREVAEGYQESADAIVDGFGHETYQSEEIAQKAEDLNGFADDLKGAADEIDSLDDPMDDDDSIMADYDGEINDDGTAVDADEAEQFVNDKREERREAAIEAASDALCNCPM